METPAVSVLMPVWNGCRDGSGAFLTLAVDSVLRQTLSDWEFVIVDDGSTDGTAELLSKYAEADPRVRVITMPSNQGIVAALNRGLSDCRAPLVARQDADDMSTATRLEIQKGFLDARPETVLCGTGMYVINEEGKLLMEVCDRPCNYAALRDALRTECMIVHGSVMFRRDAVLALGGYSPDSAYLHAEDYELWVRLAQDHVIENIPHTTLYFHRNHASKIGKTFADEQARSTERIAEKAMRLLT